MRLKIELIPRPCWFSDLRTRLKKSDWDKIRKKVYENEKMHCHICKALEAHEVWEFDEINQIQRLKDIIGVCKACHTTIHFGLAQIRGMQEKAIEQFIKVNGCSRIDFRIELLRVQEEFDRRSKIKD